MRQVELEIVNRYGMRTTQMIEVERKATLGGVIDAVRQLCRTCGWVKVRVGVGDMWSRWIY